MKAWKRCLSVALSTAMVFGTIGNLGVQVQAQTEDEPLALREGVVWEAQEAFPDGQEANVSGNEAALTDMETSLSGTTDAGDETTDVSGNDADVSDNAADVSGSDADFVGVQTQTILQADLKWRWEPVIDEWQDEYGYDPEHLWKGVVDYNVDLIIDGTSYPATVEKGALVSERSCTQGARYSTVATVEVNGQKYTDTQDVEYGVPYGHDLDPVWTLSEDADAPGLVVTQGDTCKRCNQKLSIHYIYNSKRLWPVDKEPTCSEGLSEARYEARYVVDGDEDDSFVVISDLTAIPATGVHSYMREREQQPDWSWYTRETDSGARVWTADVSFRCWNWIDSKGDDCGHTIYFDENSDQLKITSETKDGVTTYTATLTVNDFYNFETHRLDQTLTYTSVKKVTENGFSISDIPDQTYTGKPVTLDELEVWYGGGMLQAGVDYTLKYANNKNAGTASVTIIGKGMFKGTLTQTFRILPADIDSDHFSANDLFLIYNSKKAQKNPTVLYWNGTVLPKSNYTIEYTSGANDYKLPGDYTATIKAKGTNFTGKRTYTIHISDENNYIAASKVKIKLNTDYIRMTPDGFDWDRFYSVDENGLPNAFRATYKNKDVTPAFVEYWINLDEFTGKGYVNLMAEPNMDIDGVRFFGSLSVKATAKCGDISKLFIKCPTTITYPGYAIDPWDLEYRFGFMVWDSNYDEYEEGSGYTLRQGDHYAITLKGNDKAGTMTVTITGMRGYTGKVVRKIKIEKVNLAKLDAEKRVEAGTWEYDEAQNDYHLVFPETVAYSKGGAVPEYLDVGVVQEEWDYDTDTTYTWTMSLAEGKDYAVKYSGNTTVGGTATATITGKGSYEGTVTRTYKVVDRNLENSEDYYNDMTVLAKDVVLGKKVSATMKPYLAKVEVYDNISGKKLQEKKDYTLQYFYDTEEGSKAVQASDPTTGILDANTKGFSFFVEVTGVSGSGYTGTCREYYKVVDRLVKASEIKIKQQVLPVSEYGGVDGRRYFAHPNDLDVPEEEMESHQWFNPWEADDAYYKEWQDLYFDAVPDGCRVEILSLKNVSKPGTGTAVVRIVFPQGKDNFTVGGYANVKFKIVQKDLTRD